MKKGGWDNSYADGYWDYDFMEEAKDDDKDEAESPSTHEFNRMNNINKLPIMIEKSEKKRYPAGINKKILLFNHHFAIVPKQLYTDFKEQVILKGTFSDWIRKEIRNDFDYDLESADDFGYIEVKMHEAFYSDKSEWLREKMRNTLSMYSSIYDGLGYYYIARNTQLGRQLYLCEDEELMRKYHERFVCWSDDKDLKLTFSDRKAAAEYAQNELSDKVKYMILKGKYGE